MSAPCLDRSRLEIARLDASLTIPEFCCGDEDLDGFLRDDARHLQESGATQVYLAWYETELVGYAAVLADSILLRTPDVTKLRPLTSQDARTIPAVKLGRLAVAAGFRGKYSRCGTCLVQFAVYLARSVGDSVGCRLLTVDAYRQSVEFYKRLGFRLRNSDLNDAAKKTVPMWLDLLGTYKWCDAAPSEIDRFPDASAPYPST